MACRTASLALCLLAALGCAHTPPDRPAEGPPSIAPASPGAARVHAAFAALDAQKGYRVVCRVRSGRPERVRRELLIAPDYLHYESDGVEGFVRGTRLVRRSSSGRGWVREECPPRSFDGLEGVKALLSEAGTDARFEEPRTEDGCEVLEFTIEDREALERVWPVSGVTRIVVTLGVNSDGLPFRTVRRWEGPSPMEIDDEFSDFGIDSDPGIPGPVRRLLEAPDPGQLPFTEDRS